MPAPAAAAHSGTAQMLAVDQISAPLASAITASPSATTSGGRWRRCATADRLDPAMTARLNGIGAVAACSGLRCSLFCRYRVTGVEEQIRPIRR